MKKHTPSPSQEGSNKRIIIMISDRIKKLRDKMQQNNIAAYIIPSTDAHQSEYLPAVWQRRPYISGFTGSAGDVVITMDKGGLWTDGRYYAQATEQLVGSGIDLYKASDSTTVSIPGFLSTTLKPGETVGVDPKTFSYNAMQSFKNEIVQSGLKLKFIQENLVDSIWDDQPELPVTAIKVHTLKFAGESVETKLSRLRSEMKSAGCYAHVITMLDAIAWLFNLRGKDVEFNPVFIAYAIVTNNKAMLFTRKEKITDEVRQHLGNNVGVFDYNLFNEHLDKLTQMGEKVWIDGNATNYWIVSALEQKCTLFNAPSPVIKFKSIKNEAELKGYRDCQLRDGVAMVNFLHWLEGAVPKGAVTELSAANRLEQFRQEQDMFQGPSFSTISSYKIHGAIIHYSVTEESDIPLKPTGIYLIDSGGQYLDGTTDITRTVALSEPTAQEKENFTRVLMGHINLLLTSFPKGTTGPALDTIARLPLWEIGLTYNHGTGHGVGSYLAVHEGPQSIHNARAFSQPLEIGMICSNEPGYYKDREYGIRTENLINVVRDDAISNQEFEFYKFETHTLCPVDTRLVEKSLMNSNQISWLNDYHKLVREKLSPFVETGAKTWLEKATQAI